MPPGRTAPAYDESQYDEYGNYIAEEPVPLPVEPGMYTSPYVEPGTQAPHYDPANDPQAWSTYGMGPEMENDPQTYQAIPVALQPSTNHDPVREWLDTSNPFSTKTTELGQPVDISPVTSNRTNWNVRTGMNTPRMNRGTVLEMMNQGTTNPASGSALPHSITPTSSGDYWKERILGDPRAWRWLGDQITGPARANSSSSGMGERRIGRPLKGLFGGGQR